MAEKKGVFSVTTAEEKQALRRRLRAEMQQIPDAYFSMAGQIICRRILESETYQKANTLFCFVSFGKEPDTYPLLRQALKDGKTLCVPLCREKGQMAAHCISALTQLSPGAYGIPEPDPDTPILPADRIDLAVVPCLAATKSGKRLGKGGGYYDRFLAKFKGKALLICPSRLVADNLPTEEHDLLFPNILTEETDGRSEDDKF